MQSFTNRYNDLSVRFYFEVTNLVDDTLKLETQVIGLSSGILGYLVGKNWGSMTLGYLAGLAGTKIYSTVKMLVQPRTLEGYRRRIDHLDNQLLETLAKRLELMKNLAHFKHENNLPIACPDREKELLEERVDRFAKEGFKNTEFIRTLFKEIIEESRKVQEDTIRNLKE